MANVPEDLHYSKDHEWVRVEGDQQSSESLTTHRTRSVT